MILGWQEREEYGHRPENGASAWSRVEATQLHPRLPCLLAPQPAHAVLAGDLAKVLLPDCFGELPHDIKQSILMHDAGWAALDAGQIQRLRAAPACAPVSFIANSPPETAEAWTASIRGAERISPAGGLVVSRHFTLLAASGGEMHRKFLAAELVRQRKLQGSIAAGEDDLERWTAALGFCDLVSLYLITGLKGGISFPLAHPASAQAKTAPRVSLHLEGNRMRWTPRIFPAGFHASLEALKHPIQADNTRSEKLSWEAV